MKPHLIPLISIIIFDFTNVISLAVYHLYGINSFKSIIHINTISITVNTNFEGTAE